MEKLEAQLKQFSDIVKRLEDVLNQENNEFIRDSSIKRFELAFDISWKTIKTFLEEKRNIICKSPRSCFREAYKQELIDYDEFWLDIADLRNRTTHTYQEEIADEVYKKLPKILDYFKRLLNVLSDTSQENLFENQQ